jgi:catechol 2,3-dioxygenase-like lactoylglutathione lyase family enzyme
MLSDEPGVLSDFYRSTFGWSLVAQSDEGDISLSDGFLQIAIFRSRVSLGEPKEVIGFHHLGLECNDIEGIKARHRQISSRMVIISEHGDVHRGDFRLYDPECNAVSLRGSYLDGRSQQGETARIRRVVLRSLDPDRQREYYKTVFRLDEAAPGNLLTDGQVTLEFKSFYEDGRPAGRFNISEIGVDLSNAAGTGKEDAQRATSDPDGNVICLMSPTVVV